MGKGFNRYLVALIVGALGIAFAPVLAKLAVTVDGVLEGPGPHAAGQVLDEGAKLSPVAVAFWRMALASPIFLAIAWRRERGRDAAQTVAGQAARAGFTLRDKLFLIWPGVFFALDLGIWHWSFEFTSVANATIEANFAIVLVALVSWLWLKDRFDWRFPLGAVFALAGMASLVGFSFAATGNAWIGDLMGIWVAFAYSGYQLSVKGAVRRYGPDLVMGISCAAAAVLLGVGAVLTPGRFLPATGAGWLSIVALTLLAQVFGQGLIAYGMRGVPVGLASVTLILQPVGAAVLGWLILGQELSQRQAAAGALVLVGIYLARLGSQGEASVAPAPLPAGSAVAEGGAGG